MQQDLIVTSPQNPKIKSAVRLHKERAERLKRNSFAVEGLAEIGRALEAGLQVKNVFYCKEALSPEAFGLLGELRQRSRERPIACSSQVFKKLVVRKSYGISVEFGCPSVEIDELNMGATPLLLVLDSLEKPGNIGAILRTADAVGVDAVVILGERFDLFSPNTIRSSIGAVFTLPVLVLADQALDALLHKKKIKAVGSIIGDSTIPYTQESFTGACALFMGSEANGIRPYWQDKIKHQVKIPMLGAMDSLNVSVACAVLLYEALRQRTTGKA